ncbi:PASTA domain-containing protein [Streptomyces sp. NPDC050263]|uniref:PASTA domain-containing protein n=1 Tax=Streptomyces sp. NPDC050263 TaxID=3155037 RepID=UPI003435E877
MADRKLVCAITAGVIVLGGIASACDDNSGASSGIPGAEPGAGATAGSGDARPTADRKTVPEFIGMGLQAAQDSAQAAGFRRLTSHDSLGRDRNQILDRSWKVCSQTPAAGKSVSTDTELDFGAVKSEETCPAEDQSAPADAGSTMPDFKGKSVKAARGALDSSTSLTVTDVSGDDRFVLVESNWQVCTQKPAAGAKLSRQPVEFGAVKFGEICP